MHTRNIQILHLVLLAFFSLLMLHSKLTAQEMSYGFECPSKLCSIVLTGEITAETPANLTEWLRDTADFDTIVLESTGGNLSAGIEMGKIIRKSGLKTRVGGRPDVTKSEFTDICASACAYAFLGGSERSVEGKGKLGFHSFYMNEQYNKFVLAGRALVDAQEIASKIVFYLIEMGVDARIFADASNTAADDMLYLSRDRMLEYSIITPDRYSDFFLDPYKNGIVAASKRQVPTQAYDELAQVTAYCQKNTRYLLYKSTVSWLPDAGITFYFDQEDYQGIDVNSDKVEVIESNDGAFVKVEISDFIVEKILNSGYLATYLDISPIDGGEHPYKKILTVSDRKFLDAAFKLCI